MESANFEPQHKTLNIVQSQNAKLYKTHLKHNSYISAFASSLKEKHPGESPTLSDLSLRKNNFQISLPYPISKPFKCETANDPCYYLMHDKIEYKKKLVMYKQFYNKDKKSIRNQSFKKKKTDLINLPHYLVDLAIYGDKNPYFDATYDYFYTGGNLSKVILNGDTYLVSVQEEELVYTNIETGTIQDESLTVKTPIYNIQGYNYNNSNCITLRSKNFIEIKKVGTLLTNEMETKTIYKSKDKSGVYPYTDVRMMDENRVASANVKYEVTMFDINQESECVKRTFEVDNVVADLCQLEFVNDSLLFMDRTSISLVDLKSSDTVEPKVLQLKDGYFECNDLCAISLSSKNTNFMYVASKHCIYKCDLREMVVIKKWAHLLDHSPIVIKTLPMQNDEYVFVSSFHETVCLHVSMDNHLPFKVSMVADTFLDFKMHNQCVFRPDLEQRFKFSTTGFEVNESPNGTYLFTSNSIGDIFQSNIVSDAEDNQKKEDAMRKLKNYIKQVPVNPKQLELTHLKELSTIKNVVWCKRDDDGFPTNAASNKRLKRFLSPMHKYGKYDIATIWDSDRVSVDDIEAEKQQKARLNDWLAQSTAQLFEHELNVPT